MSVSATPPAFVRRWWPWILIVAAALILPVILPPFRLNLLGRFLSTLVFLKLYRLIQKKTLYPSAKYLVLLAYC